MGALERAAGFVRREARVLDRRRFAYHFEHEPARPVVDALRAYANADGGFGHALEADLRSPDSQPVAVNVALSHLVVLRADEPDLVDACCGFLDRVSEPDGNVPIILPSALRHPHADHWSELDWPLDSPNPTAGLVGQLHALGAEHPWLDRATAWCWARLDEPIAGAHEVREALTFLEHVPDRERARSAAQAARGSGGRSPLPRRPGQRLLRTLAAALRPPTGVSRSRVVRRHPDRRTPHAARTRTAGRRRVAGHLAAAERRRDAGVARQRDGAGARGAP